jgi:hypothetical protein
MACGRSYFIADTTVRIRSNIHRPNVIKNLNKNQPGNRHRHNNFLQFHEHDRVDLGNVG